MPNISNVAIYGLSESIFRSGYPMMETSPTQSEFVSETNAIKTAIDCEEYDNQHIKRAISLSKAKGGGHDQFLTGIVVQFDLTISNKSWVEAERYHFLDFISSMSTMHRVGAFDIEASCNSYVSQTAIKNMEEFRVAYKEVPIENVNEKKEAYLKLLYNIPSGFELTAGMTTNYRCLKNIYKQRRTHRLPDWKYICDWIETLPMSKELICNL